MNSGNQRRELTVGHGINGVVVLAVAVGTSLWSSACSFDPGAGITSPGYRNSPGYDGSAPPDVVHRTGLDSGGTVPAGPCTNLGCYQTECTLGDCKVPMCTGGARTTVSGTVFDPGGNVPLYNVMVYVPNDTPADIPDGASCQTCDTVATGHPLTSALTDEHGNFSVPNVPVGDNIPLVIQIGKWRRQLTIPTVAACTDTPITNKMLTRLPSKQSEGHIPKIALATGNADVLECLLRKIGIDQSEFTPETGTGRVNFYAGYKGTANYSAAWNNGAQFTPANPWWDSLDNLKKYDMVILSCDGVEFPMDKSAAATAAMKNYLDMGGRVFASHWHNYWFEHGPQPFPTIATFDHQKDLDNPTTATIDQSFPKGMALANWLVNTGSRSPLGQISIRAGQHTIDAVNAAVAQRWIYTDTSNSGKPSIQYLTLNTPLVTDNGNPDGSMECGRAVLTDIHVSSGDKVQTAYPNGCTTTTLSDQEKALEFMLFDLSACVQPDSQVPLPPIDPMGPT